MIRFVLNHLVPVNSFVKMRLGVYIRPISFQISLEFERKKNSLQ